MKSLRRPKDKAGVRQYMADLAAALDEMGVEPGGEFMVALPSDLVGPFTSAPETLSPYDPEVA